MMADLLVGEDDILNSVVNRIQTGSVKVKDISGTTDFLSGPFKNVFPDVTVYPKGSLQMETPPDPFIEVGLFMRGREEDYLSAIEPNWVLTMKIVATKFSSPGTPDSAASYAFMYQLNTAIRQLFEETPSFNLYSYTYDGKTPVENGILTCTDFSLTASDDPYTLDAVVVVSGRIIGM